MRLRLANSAILRTARSSSSPMSRKLPSRASSWRLRRADNTVMLLQTIYLFIYHRFPLPI